MAQATPRIEDAINKSCPWSGKPIAADSLTHYRGKVVGFCNPGCKDKFEKAAAMFDGLIDAADKR
jgi:YHS domain-containing protein